MLWRAAREYVLDNINVDNNTTSTKSNKNNIITLEALLQSDNQS